MKKLLVFLVVFLSSIFICAEKSLAKEHYIALASASLHTGQVTISQDLRPKQLKNFLTKYNSPLLPYSQMVIYYADLYQIPWTLVVAISGVESTFCQHIPRASHNCWGWNNGNFAFKSYNHAIETVTKSIKLKYYNRGLNTPEKMGRVYAPPSHTWAGKVRYFTYLIENESSSDFLAEQFTL